MDVIDRQLVALVGAVCSRLLLARQHVDQRPDRFWRRHHTPPFSESSSAPMPSANRRKRQTAALFRDDRAELFVEPKMIRPYAAAQILDELPVVHETPLQDR